jgi:hypothetical protein
MKKVYCSATMLLIALLAKTQMDIPPVGFNPRATVSEEV